MPSTESTRRVEDALITLVGRVSDPRKNDYLARRAGVDIERSSWTLLAKLDSCQPARLSDLAESSGLDVSTVSRQVGGLVERGLIAQNADDRDKRAKLHSLSELGEQYLGRIRETRWEWLNEVLADFTPEEREIFGVLMERFVTAMVELGTADEAAAG